jgi:ketosteroid isomerase-like protein
MWLTGITNVMVVLGPALADMGESQPPAASPRPAAAADKSDERGAIEAALARYTAALEAKDLAALKAVWPALTEDQERKIRASFQATRVLKVQLVALDVVIAGASATASCRRRDQIVTLEGTSFQRDGKATIRLAKQAGAWTIESIQ